MFVQGESDDLLRKFSLHIHQEHQSCQEVVLPYQPYQLLHCSVPSTVGEQVSGYIARRCTALCPVLFASRYEATLPAAAVALL